MQPDLFSHAQASDRRHRNHFLFSDYYLDELLFGSPAWQQQTEAALHFFEAVKALYAAEKANLATTYNENQNETHWIQPILDLLGWGNAYETQAIIPALQAKKIRKPDYVFFPSGELRQAAAARQNTITYAQDAVLIGDAKKWGVALNKKQGGKPTFENNNPSHQIDYYLRATDVHWGMLTNGRFWRLVHKESSYKLDVYFEIDLLDILTNNSKNGALYFWLFFRHGAFVPDDQGQVFVDEALTASLNYAREVENDLRDNAYKALEQLIQGFFAFGRNGLSADNPGHLDTVYSNSLYLLYRLLFLLYGESRGLLPLNNRKYNEVSLTALVNEVASKLDVAGYQFSPFSIQYWARQQDLCHIINGTDPAANDYYAIPRYNGGLFSPTLHPFLEQYKMGDAHLLRAIDYLARRDRHKQGEKAIKERVDYRTLGVRQLGSIYEGLLEYRPARATEAMATIRRKGSEVWVAASKLGKKKPLERREVGDLYLATDKGERKATGSYYTPDYIVRYIVEQTLQPLIDEIRAAVADLPEAAQGDAFAQRVLALNVLDPAMGSGHFLVAAAEYLALALTNADIVTPPDLPHSATMSELERQAQEKNYWLRRVTEACIYGVDKNRMAVELAKLSLWLTTVSADKPLSFLDHHLRHGDSLVGARLADLAALPSGRKSEAATAQLSLIDGGKLTTDLNLAVGRMMAIERATSDSLADIHLKEALFGELRGHVDKWRRLANVWVSSYFGNGMSPQEYGDVARLLQGKQTTASAAQLQPFLDHPAVADNDYFHWELEFPEVFFDEYGRSLSDRAGFDAVIGNPPYVATSAIDKISREFYRIVFNSSGKEINLFALFTEQGLNLKAHTISYIVPDSFLNVQSYSGLRQQILEQTKIKSLIEITGDVFKDAILGKVSVFVIEKENSLLIRDTNLVSIYNQVAGKEIVLQGQIEQRTFKELPDFAFITRISSLQLLQKLKNGRPNLIEVADIRDGVKTGQNSRFLSSQKHSDRYKPILSNSDIHRYSIRFADMYLDYDRDNLARPREEEIFLAPAKIIMRQTGDRLIAAIDTQQFYTLDNTRIILPQPEISITHLTSLLNSKLLNYAHEVYAGEAGRVYAQIRIANLEKLPIQLEGNDEIEALATKMAEIQSELLGIRRRFWDDIEGIADIQLFHKVFDKGKWEESVYKSVKAARPFVREDSRSTVMLDAALGWNEEAFKGFVKLLAGKVKGMADLLDVYRHYHPEYRALSQKIAATDSLIDQLVYQLYGLTEEEIALVEAATA